MAHIPRTMLLRIQAKGPGAVFVPADFTDLGKRDAVDQALSRLVQAGKLRRLAQGLFDNPQTHPKLGLLSPDTDKVADAIARKTNARIQISGARAANALGLSLQVPARPTYLTDGPSRDVRIGQQVIQFRHTSPRNLAGGPVVQALRFIGREQVTSEIIAKLRQRLTDADKLALQQDLPLAPEWMQQVLTQILQ